MTILVANTGSSSLKLDLLAAHQPSSRTARATVSRIGSDNAALAFTAGSKTEQQEGLRIDYREAFRLCLAILDQSLVGSWRSGLEAVGHRIVHGGASFRAPTLLTPDVERQLQSLIELAPLHNGPALAVVGEALAALPQVPQIACFDTMFHADLPPEAARYALPRRLCDDLGIRRYGFHGLSCYWSIHRLAELQVAPREKVIICHLGAGSSVTAVRDGHSIDTTMGFTPLEGVIMATRSGSIDPSIPLYLQRHAGMSLDQVEHLLDREAGLLGLSGTSGDVQTLEQAAEAGDEQASGALAAYAYSIRKAIGAFWAALGGLDVLVFTGGIGENDATMRARIISPLARLGLRLDISANTSLQGEGSIGVSGAVPAIRVITAQEAQAIVLLIQSHEAVS